MDGLGLSATNVARRKASSWYVHFSSEQGIRRLSKAAQAADLIRKLVFLLEP